MADEVVCAGPNRAAGIDAGVSSYLDLLRLAAALVVVMSHMLPNLFGSDVVPGHDAVIVFFVMSGYVITYAAEQRDRSLNRFIVNRLARLWSVLLPSLLVSAVAAMMIGSHPVVLFASPIAEPGWFVATAMQNALFLGQNWFVANPVPYNDPAWSLGYEAWYYAIFAAFVFAPKRWRWHAAGAGVFLAGPPIVALMPCWVLGAWLYKRRERLVLPAAAAYVLFAACVLLYGAFYAADVGVQNRAWLSELTGNHSFRLRASTRFISDFLSACLFCGTIIAVGSMPAVNRGFVAASLVCRMIASRTFSLYLFHMPVFAIVYGGFGIGRAGLAGKISCIALVLVLCVLLGTVTEAKVAAWRRVVQRAVDALTSSAIGLGTAYGQMRSSARH